MKRLFVTKPSMPDYEEYCQEIKALWDTRILTNMASKHNELEQKLADYLKVGGVSLFTNGHLALEHAISSLNLTGEIITTPFTFVSTTNAIVRNGLKPVFCDIDLEDYTIDVKKIEELITPKTSAIIPVHVYGTVCNVYEIEKLAKKYNLKVIYDAAHAFGESIDGQGVGAFGDLSIFSFHATKVYNTVEGGCIAYNGNEKIKQDLIYWKDFGISDSEHVIFKSGNAKMDELRAAMGICNLRHVDEEISKRKRVYDLYKSYLDKINGLKIRKIQDNVISNYAYFPILLDGYKYTRDQLCNKLADNGIYSRKYFYPLTSNFEALKEFDTTKTPIAEYVSDRILCLPMYADLTDEDIAYICESILG